MNVPHTSFRRGVALLLAMMAVLISSVLAYSFVGRQETAIAITRNVRHTARARQVAESGLQVALGYIEADDDWRDERTHGVWASSVPFSGGSYKVVGEDGYDANGDGIVEGDGDLGDDPDDLVTLTVTGSVDGCTAVVRAVVTPVPACNSPGIVVSNSIEAKDTGAEILPMAGGASIATNSTANGKVKVSKNAAVKTDIFVGPGANAANEPGGVVSVSDGGTISGSIHALDQAIPIPSPSAPSDVGTSLGNLTLTSGTTTWSTSRRYNKLTLLGNATVQVSGNINVLCDGVVEFIGTPQITILDNSTLTLYLGNKLTAGGNSSVNTTTGDPGRLIIRSLASGASAAIDLSTSASVCAAIEAPNSTLTLSAGQLHGTFVGDSVKVEGNGKFRVDCREMIGGGDVRVSGNSNDAEEDPGGDVKLNNAKLEMGQMPWVGLRFQNVTVPQGATITSAHVQFTAADSNTESTSLTLYGIAQDNTAAFTTSKYNMSGRSRTSASATWNSMPNWSMNNTYNTPSLTSVVQEIVNRSGWSSGNAMGIVLKSTNLNGKRLAVAHDDNSSKAALLHIEYQGGGGSGGGQTAYTYLVRRAPVR